MFNLFRRGAPDRKKNAALFNEIGTALVEEVGQLEAKILLYAEIELSEIDDDYGIDYFVRFARDGSSTVESAPPGDRLATAMHKLLAFAKTMDKSIDGRAWNTSSKMAKSTSRFHTMLEIQTQKMSFGRKAHD